LYAIVVRTNYPFDDPAFTLALVDEGIHIATLLGDSSAVGAFISLRGWVAGTDGDWATTLRTRRCECRTRPSISRCSCRAGEH